MSDDNEAVGLIVELYRAKTDLEAKLERAKAERDAAGRDRDEAGRDLVEIGAAVAEVYGFNKTDPKIAVAGLVFRHKALRATCDEARAERDEALARLESVRRERDDYALQVIHWRTMCAQGEVADE